MILNSKKCTLGDVVLAEELEIVEWLGSFQGPVLVDVGQSWLELQSVEDDFVNFKHGQYMGASQFVSLTLRLLHLEGV